MQPCHKRHFAPPSYTGIGHEKRPYFLTCIFVLSAGAAPAAAFSHLPFSCDIVLKGMGETKCIIHIDFTADLLQRAGKAVKATKKLNIRQQQRGLCVDSSVLLYTVVPLPPQHRPDNRVTTELGTVEQESKNSHVSSVRPCSRSFNQIRGF